MSIFLNDWSKEYLARNEGNEGYGDYTDSLEQLKYDFEITDEDLEGINIILADYTYEYYSGNAFVLFEKDGKLYEVNGSHCSCYGLEGQWTYEEVLLEELKNRIESHYDFDGCREEMRKVVNDLISQNKYK
jgi:hypothetical protein